MRTDINVVHLVCVVALTVGFAVPATLAAPVTTCGQVVTERRAELAADLDCSGFAGDAVVLQRGGRMLLNGFTLVASSEDGAIECEASCKVFGPGTIRGGAGYAVAALRPPPARPNARIAVDNVTLDAAGSISSDSSVKVRRSTITNATVYGVAAPTAAILRDSTITGSGSVGVAAARIKLIDSEVVDNGLDPDRCSPSLPGLCCDLLTFYPPRLTGTSRCGTSKRNASGVPFGVCEND